MNNVIEMCRGVGMFRHEELCRQFATTECFVECVIYAAHEDKLLIGYDDRITNTWVNQWVERDSVAILFQ